MLTARAENHLYGADDLDDTIARLRAYRDAGAEVLYAPGLVDLDQIAAVVRAVERPVTLRMTAWVGPHRLTGKHQGAGVIPACQAAGAGGIMRHAGR